MNQLRWIREDHAAHHIGRSVLTLRAWHREGLVTRRRLGRGRYFYRVSDLRAARDEMQTRYEERCGRPRKDAV